MPKKLRELEQACAVGRKPLNISPAAAKSLCACGHRRDAHTIPYELKFSSMRCSVSGCTCFEFTKERP